MSNNKNKPVCECGTVEDLASDPKSAIEYDESLQEYNLVSGHDKVHYRMYFCFFCGGKLPESKRASLFTEPSEKEQREVLEVMSKVRSMEEARHVLGKPDETIKAPNAESQENGKSPYKKHYRYLKRWQTLDFTIREREDGSIDSAFTGKYKSESRQVKRLAKR
jgi:hypothetical protein